MSAPTPAIRLDLHRLSLDDLGLLVRHPRANGAVRRAFVAALSTWTRARVAMLTRTMRTLNDADREDIVQDFLLRCLTRHLRQWQPATATISAFLFPRLRGSCVDAWRRSTQSLARDGGDDVDVVDERTPAEDHAARRSREACYDVCEAVIGTLPRRRRAVMRHVLAGASLAEAAAALRIHPSTASRERSAALGTLREALDAFGELAPGMLAA